MGKRWHGGVVASLPFSPAVGLRGRGPELELALFGGFVRLVSIVLPLTNSYLTRAPIPVK